MGNRLTNTTVAQDEVFFGSKTLIVALNAIQRLRLLLADQPEPHIALDLRAVALLRVAEAAAPRHVDDQAFAGRDGLEALGLEFLARRQRQPAFAAGSAAVTAARRMLHPLEGGEDAERRAFAMLDFHDLAESAAILAGAAGILAVLLLPDDDGRDGLGDLDRDVAHARRKRSRRQAVEGRARAGAAGMEGRHHEGPTVADRAGHAVAGAELQVPEIAGAFAEPYELDLPRALAIALDRRTELKALTKAQALRKEDVISARSGYKPALQGYFGYDVHNSVLSDDPAVIKNGWIAGAQMSWNLFDGWRTRGRVVEATANYERAGIDLDDAARRIQLDVRTAHSNFIQAREVLESQKKVVEEGEEALRLARARAEAGTGTQLDVLSAQTALTESRTTEVQALHDYEAARARLQRAVGLSVPTEAQ